VGAILILSLAGCDTTVQPIDPQGRHYSLFGYLDAARDTQFVRVEPLNDSMPVGAPSRIDARVTLTRVGTGETFVLTDSVRRFNVTGLLGEEAVLVHNFWTTAPIEPGGQYRLTARRSDGAQSWATATLPNQPPTVETLRKPFLPCNLAGEATATVRISTARLVGITVVYPLPSGPADADYHGEAIRQNGAYRLEIDYREDLERFGASSECARVQGDALELIAYAGGVPWPRFADGGDRASEAVARLDTLSNVRRGVGFFGGTISTRVKIPVLRLDNEGGT
jgi:hypothetical protein